MDKSFTMRMDNALRVRPHVHWRLIQR